MQFSPDRPAPEVDTALRKSLEEVRRAEGQAVLWFTEVNRRRLYRDLGFGSIYQYAEESLGFSRPRTAQFLRLAESFEKLSLLRESLIAGRTTWTKARTVARVAIPRTEERWVTLAETLGRKELEERVRRVLVAARRHRRNRKQARLELTQPTDHRPSSAPSRVPSAPEVALELAPPSEPGKSVGAEPGGGRNEASHDPSVEAQAPATVSLFDDVEPEIAEVPVTVSLRMSPLQVARYEALVEKARKRGVRGDGVDLILAGLEELVVGTPAATSRPRPETQPTPEPTNNESVASSLRRFPRGNSSPYEIHVAVCPGCARGRVETSRGVRALGLPELRAAACDARVRGQEGVNRSTIPLRVRRAVLDRDGHRCRAAGCGATRFLEVHHRVPRSRGGSNRPANLITLCSGCHRATHVHDPGDAPLRN